MSINCDKSHLDLPQEDKDVASPERLFWATGRCLMVNLAELT
ncbi:hypothetical protein T02_1751 [Trichinella nativa]|uniref:Uncharacterized protein n=3 Tax=Trichinella TaxID=6333 RepID=A0A0V1L7H8_9BILA|nr:hypothetical protein T05_8491 [Trichinella murrelli]KRX65737.1 hypothetical protein T09_55 [Trichinella sp. T9]KRY48880.1 hypothetical protein T03_1575 [Trichinella britovi]KRZ55488.1 hypothetical protein T02_1751 [Trichinella nativa]